MLFRKRNDIRLALLRVRKVIRLKAGSISLLAQIFSLPKAIYARDQYPSQVEWGLRRAYLAKRGISQKDIDLILGKRNDEFLRVEAVDNLILYCRYLLKVR